jgi:hypothetical protein
MKTGQERTIWAANIKVIGMGLLKPLGTRVIPPHATDAGQALKDFIFSPMLFGLFGSHSNGKCFFTL